MSLPRTGAGVPTPLTSKVGGQAGVVDPVPPLPVPSAFSPDPLEWEEWRGDWPFIHHAIAGSFAGVMEHITMYPIDTIKTRMQAFRGTSSAASSSQPCGPRRPSSGPSKGDRLRCGGGASQAGAPPTSNSAGRGAEGQRRFLTLSASPRGLRRAATQGGRSVAAPEGGTQRLPWASNAGEAPTVSPLGRVAGSWRERLSRSSLQGGAPRAPPWTLCAAARGANGFAELRPRLLAIFPPARRQRLTCTAWGSSSCAEAIRGTVSSAREGGGLVGGQVKGTVLAEGTGLVAGLRTVYLEGGLFGLYRGAGAVVAGCVPAHACYFMSYEFVKERMGERARARQHHQQQPHSQLQAAPEAPAASVQGAGGVKPAFAGELVATGEASGVVSSLPEEEAEARGQRLTHGELLACGMCATFSHDLILTPVDVVKQRMQLGCFRSLTECVTSTLRREGPLAFVRSLPVSVLLNLPHGATLVYVNETLKSRLTASQPSALPSLPTYFFCAGVSGGVAGLISNPLDVVKTRLQTQDCAIREGHAAGFCMRALSRAALAGVLKPGSCAFAPCPPKYNVDKERVRGAALQVCLPRYRDSVRTQVVRSSQRFMRHARSQCIYVLVWLQGVSSRVCLSIPSTAICWGEWQRVAQLSDTRGVFQRAL
ncbi:hypothetical protein Emag_003078 [Eimeria magna]